eukprot:7115653-Prymnesium_polylepis.1
MTRRSAQPRQGIARPPSRGPLSDPGEHVGQEGGGTSALLGTRGRRRRRKGRSPIEASRARLRAPTLKPGPEICPRLPQHEHCAADATPSPITAGGASAQMRHLADSVELASGESSLPSSAVAITSEPEGAPKAEPELCLPSNLPSGGLAKGAGCGPNSPEISS